MNFRYIVMLLGLSFYSIEAVEFDNLEKLNAHLQQVKSNAQYLNFYKVGIYTYDLASVCDNDGLQACDLWAYRDEQTASMAKLLRWNNQKNNMSSFNEEQPVHHSSGNKATNFINSIVSPAQPNRPGFFTIKDSPTDWYKLGERDDNCYYEQTQIKKFDNRNLFTVTTIQEKSSKTATVKYRPQETENFTSLEVVVGQEQKTVKAIKTRINKTTCVSLLVGALGAWLTWSHFRK